MAVFPSREWIEEVLKAAERSEEYKEAAKDWEGDFLCKIESDKEFLADMGRKEVVEGFLSFLDMMPVDDRKKYSGTPMGDVVEKKLGIPLDASMTGIDAGEVLGKFSKLSEADFAGAALYFWADFWHGAVRNMKGVAPGDHEDAVFKLSGKFGNWKLLVTGKQDAVKLTMSNKLKLEGDLSYMMRRIRAVTTLSKEVFAGVPID
jgi:putative sterol carrier protein